MEENEIKNKDIEKFIDIDKEVAKFDKIINETLKDFEAKIKELILNEIALRKIRWNNKDKESYKELNNL